jgi:hypothetical protein
MTNEEKDLICETRQAAREIFQVSRDEGLMEWGKRVT